MHVVAVDTVRRLLVAVVIAVVCGCALAGCGEEADGQPVLGTRLTIYSSMPLAGPEAPAARAVLRGQELALHEHGRRIGRYEIRFVSLDAATLERRGWDPVRISENARAAVADEGAIAYIGEFHAGSSAISIPLLNEAGILTVSPLDTAKAFTSHNPAVPDSPEKYYPRAAEVGRTFVRLVPSDRVQALAQLRYMEQEGVRRLVLLSDEDPVGVGYVTEIRSRAAEHGITVVGDESVDPHQPEAQELVERVVKLEPDAVFYAGGPHDAAVWLWQRLAAAAPTAKLFMPGALVDTGFVDAVGPAAAALTHVTRPVLPLAAYPTAAQRFARRFARHYGIAPTAEALYGYEAMRAVLAAIRTAAREAGDAPIDRAAVVRALRGNERRDTVLGTYAILGSGDSTLRRFGAYRIVDGELHFVRALDV